MTLEEDARLAREVMGWKDRGNGLFWSDVHKSMRSIRGGKAHEARIKMNIAEHDEQFLIWSPSTQDAAATETLVKFSDTREFRIETAYTSGTWTCSVFRKHDGQFRLDCQGDTRPEAIAGVLIKMLDLLKMEAAS